MPPLYHKLAVRQPAAAASWRRHVLVRKIKVLAPEVRGLFSSLRARYEEKGESIMSIAASVGYPPYLLCRIFIEVSVHAMSKQSHVSKTAFQAFHLKSEQ